MAQQTLGIISLNIKDDILSKISASKLKVVHEKQFNLTAETCLEILNKKLGKTLSVYGFILEGTNAITDWFQITSNASPSKRPSAFIYASTVENAQSQVDWFKNIVLRDLSIEKNTSTASSTSSSSIPIKVKKQQQKPKSVNVSDAPPQKKPLRSSLAQQQQQQPRSTSSRLTHPSTRRTANAIATTTATATTSTGNRSKIPNSKAARPTSAASTTKVKTPATNTTVTPTKRIVNEGTKPANGRRGSLVASTLTAATSSKKLLNTTSKGGVIKNTPPISVLTGRTRKPSRLTEKRPVVTNSLEKIDVVHEQEKQQDAEEEIKIEAQEKPDEGISLPPSPSLTTATDAQQQQQQQEEETTKDVTAQEATCDNMIEPQHIVSYPSTCSSAATDEHDAEVAAATSRKDTAMADAIDITTTTASSSFASTNTVTTLPLLCNSGRSSFSPNSIASLPRPETPEVDQLRLRFETIIQTSATNVSGGGSGGAAGTQDFVPRRPSSSKLSQQELAARIKEMKPRGPAGSRVKSMVELFMDENLNKWEF